MECVATALAASGMAMSSDKWQENWDLGPNTYWLVLGTTVVSWQLCFVGTAGMIFLTSSLHSGICMTALLPINVMAGVALFGDELGPVKCISMVLCVWGFASYVYGEYKKNQNVAIEGDVGSNVVTVVVVEKNYGSVNGVVENV
jgi:Purine nucleobase transmembrane transport